MILQQFFLIYLWELLFLVQVLNHFNNEALFVFAHGEQILQTTLFVCYAVCLLSGITQRLSLLVASDIMHLEASGLSIYHTWWRPSCSSCVWRSFYRGRRPTWRITGSKRSCPKANIKLLLDIQNHATSTWYVHYEMSYSSLKEKSARFSITNSNLHSPIPRFSSRVPFPLFVFTKLLHISLLLQRYLSSVLYEQAPHIPCPRKLN